ncbi:hypothetical protein OQA88_808 [Cercophora sp. LCS_1]
MRLIDVETLSLQWFFSEIPPYAVFSHLWEQDEVTFSEMTAGPKLAEAKRGFVKIQRASLHTRQAGLRYLWIDTCCIDKASSAELSEAINAMFKIYRDAAVCLAYLPDVTRLSDLRRSRWFTRGWTLQELIAPGSLEFYDFDWELLGTREELSTEIAKITGIPGSILSRQDGHLIDQVLEGFSLSDRFRWAASRRCTRLEDTTYSLLGIFGVNMPLLYGEGERAFLRLQECILEDSDDHSILAFRSLDRPSSPATERTRYTPVFADSPGLFQDKIETDWSMRPGKGKMSFADGELNIELLLCQPLKSPFGEDPRDHYIGILDCVVGHDLLSRPAILLRRMESSDKFQRIGNGLLFEITPDEPDTCSLMGHKDPEDAYRVIFNPSDARRAQITLTSYKPVARFQEWKFPPIKLSGLDKLEEVGYTISQSTSTLSGNYLTPQHSAESIGVISLASTYSSVAGLLVVWGFAPAFPNGPWCRILTESQFAARKSRRHSIRSFLDRIISKARENDEQTRLYLEPDPSDRRKADSVIEVAFQPPLHITVRLSILSFLDRTAIDLQFDAISEMA